MVLASQCFKGLVARDFSNQHRQSIHGMTFLSLLAVFGWGESILIRERSAER